MALRPAHSECAVSPVSPRLRCVSVSVRYVFHQISFALHTKIEFVSNRRQRFCDTSRIMEQFCWCARFDYSN